MCIKLESMKFATTMCFCWYIMLVIVFSGAAEYEEINGNLAGYSTVTFDLTNGAQAYPSFVTRLRNVMEAPARVCGFQSTRRNPLPGNEYVYVDLKISNSQWVTLGVDATTLYIWGYRDNLKYNGNYRATFFIDAPEDAKSKLFRGSTFRTTRFTSGYTSLERAADVTRLDQQLGIPNLDGAIRSVYGRQENELNQGKEEAKFLLIVVQMVAVATRFQFIMDAIVRNDNMPDFKRKMASFQNDWKKISKVIYKAEAGTPKCTKISPTLIITNYGYRQEVTAVDEIKNDIALVISNYGYKQEVTAMDEIKNDISTLLYQII